MVLKDLAELFFTRCKFHFIVFKTMLLKELLFKNKKAGTY
jgi:hypothetical protein